MNATTRKYQALIQALQAGQLVVTASHRLAREVLLYFADSNLEHHAVWERPKVLPWPDWLRDLWQRAVWSGSVGQDLRLLSNGQFQLLWEQVVYKSEGDRLMQAGAAARQAAQAWELAHAWRLPWQQARDLASEDAGRFLDWAQAYSDACEQAGWTDRARLPDLIAGLLAGKRDGLAPPTVLLAGFDEFTPQQQALLDTLQAAGTEITRWLPVHEAGTVQMRGASDAQVELSAAANWCAEALKADPQHSIGVVVPDLSERYEEVARIFEDVLSPGACERLSVKQEQIFSISAGPPLTRHPMIKAALGILELADSVPPWAQASNLLRSRFLGDGIRESDRRAELDAVLRDVGGTRWSLEAIAHHLHAAVNTQSGHECPALLARIEKAIAMRAEWPQSQETHGWVQAISAWLDVFGWPGETTLNSDEFQLLERWRELLEEIAAFEAMLGKTSLNSVLRRVQRLSADARFKPESGRCAVQVLGVLEAAGLEFDRLWVCGLHDGVFPSAPAPTAFLPYALQRSLGMPHSSSARELAIAGLQLQRLTNSASKVVLSWPKKAGDQELRPSPLIEAFPEAECSEAGSFDIPGRNGDLFEARPALECLAEDNAPALTSEESLRGGVRMLELQAWCPFRAFAELRLGSRPLAQPAPGLDAINRGSLAHDSLFELWRVLGDQETLAGLAPRARTTLVRRSIAKAIRSLKVDSDALITHLLELESRRLQRLIEALLDLELARPPFKVAMLEQRKSAVVGPLRLRTRLDRLDVLATGGHLLIDYKTGGSSPVQWFGTRPRAPQLPLYASSLGLEQIRGLAFVSIRSASVQFAGVCDAKPGMPEGIKPPSQAQWLRQGIASWPDLLLDWQHKLARLAADLHQGQCRVDPLAEACRNCHLSALCRVDEKRELGELADDA